MPEQRRIKSSPLLWMLEIKGEIILEHENLDFGRFSVNSAIVADSAVCSIVIMPGDLAKKTGCLYARAKSVRSGSNGNYQIPWFSHHE